MHLCSEKSHLDQLFHCQSSRYDVIKGIFGPKNKGCKLICNSPNDIISGKLTVKKLMKVGFFIIKIYYISSSNDPNITHTKNHISG
jgi:hypothetical protein